MLKDSLKIKRAVFDGLMWHGWPGKTNMIIVQIIGGLGNQMFQYAAARSLAIKNCDRLALDVSGFDSYRLHHGFELARIFGTHFCIASTHNIHALLGWRYSSSIRRIVSQKPFSVLFSDNRYVVEPYFHYWDEINNLGKNVYLSGYWQSEKYFMEAAMQIRQDFAFSSVLRAKNKELAASIGAVRAVSLHVRRGDYVSNPKTATTHGLCSIPYYMEAIRYIEQAEKSPHFFIFSDDINWARNNLRIKHPCVYVDHNVGSESYNDMRLMSLCDHHIIANSSFSWWGAWLNPNPDKIVIAPQKWFVNENNVGDLFPDGWVVLDV